MVRRLNTLNIWRDNFSSLSFYLWFVIVFQLTMTYLGGEAARQVCNVLIHDVNPSQLSGAFHRSSEEVVARSINGCAARHGNASR